MHSVEMSGGQAMKGGVESITVTLKQQRDEFPEPSVAVQQTSVVPNANSAPDSGAQVTGTFGSHASEAVAL